MILDGRAEKHREVQKTTAAANSANPRSLGKETGNFCAGIEQRPCAVGFSIEEAKKEPGKGKECVPTRLRHATIPHQQRKFPHAKKRKFLRKFRKASTTYYCACNKIVLRTIYCPRMQYGTALIQIQSVRMHLGVTVCLNKAINTKNSKHQGAKAELHDDVPTRAAWVVITTAFG